MAINPNRHLLSEPLALIHLHIVHVLIYDLVVATSYSASNRPSRHMGLSGHAHGSSEISSLHSSIIVTAKFLLRRAPCNLRYENFFLIDRGLFTPKVCVDTLISTCDGSSWPTSRWLVSVAEVSRIVSHHYKLTAAGSDINYLFHLFY